MSIKDISGALTNVSKLVLISYRQAEGLEGLLEGLAFHLESLVLAEMSLSFVQPISIMARLKRLELYEVKLADLDLTLLRVVLGRLEHLVLGNSWLSYGDIVSLETWSTLFGYLKPGQLKHLGLIGFTFPWNELFVLAGRRLLAGITSLQLGALSLANLQAIVRIFAEYSLGSLNFETFPEEEVSAI